MALDNLIYNPNQSIGVQTMGPKLDQPPVEASLRERVLQHHQSILELQKQLDELAMGLNRLCNILVSQVGIVIKE
jgi:hypothetical protein